MAHNILLNISQTVATLFGLAFLIFSFWFEKSNVGERLKIVHAYWKSIQIRKRTKRLKILLKKHLYDIVLFSIPPGILFFYIVPSSVELIGKSIDYAEQISKMNLTEQNLSQIDYNVDKIGNSFSNWILAFIAMFAWILADTICYQIYFKQELPHPPHSDKHHEQQKQDSIKHSQIKRRHN